jgi:dUTP pyrophosphatase
MRINMSIKLYVKQLTPTAKVPFKAYEEDTGWDIYNDGSDITVHPRSRYTFPTGLAVTTDPGWFIKLESRSGLAHKFGGTLLCGIIDRGYRNELGVVFHNTSEHMLQVVHGERIAQIVLLPLPQVSIEIVEDLPVVDSRGLGGFGSSGRV